MAVTKEVVLVLALALVIAHCDIIDDPQDEIEDYVAVEEDTFLDYVEKRGECKKPNAKENRSVQQLNKDMLKWHKYYRCLHGVPKLSYSTALEQKARQHVEQLLQQGTFEHIKPNNYGENLWTKRAYPEFGIGAITGEEPVRYDEIDDPGYDFNRPTMFTSGTGHFSQVVWKDTKRLGCWVGERKNYPSQGWTRVVVGCEYDPPGNVGSIPAYWKEMVPPPNQVVWKDTKRLGCWVGERKNYPSQGWTRVVVGCEYDPPGNVGSVPAYWKEMVPPLK